MHLEESNCDFQNTGQCRYLVRSTTRGPTVYSNADGKQNGLAYGLLKEHLNLEAPTLNQDCSC